jgi:hypothetical protein
VVWVSISWHTQYTRTCTTVCARNTTSLCTYAVYASCLLAAAPKSRHTLTLLCSCHLTRNSVSVFIRLWCMDNKKSWLGGWASQWRPPHHYSDQTFPIFHLLTNNIKHTELKFCLLVYMGVKVSPSPSGVSKNRVLKYTFESDRKEMTGKWTKLDSEQLHDLYSSPNVIWVIKAW